MRINLSEQFLEISNFESALQEVAFNQGCAGVDGETISHFLLHEEDYLTHLIAAISIGKYRPMPLRQFFIPKSSGGWRRLRVPTVRDRIVQQALLNVLYPVIEPQFEPCSFAYRPQKSHLMAVRQVDYWHHQGYEWVLDADIVEYFDSIAHARLLAEVAERVDEPLFLSLISAWISVGALSKAGLILPQKGIPQGAVISPILANIYLDDFDEIMGAAKLKLVRYADDFVVMARSEHRIVEAKKEIDCLLAGMELQLNLPKTRIVNFQQGFRFLGHIFAGDVILPAKKVATSPAVSIVAEDSHLRLVHADAPAKATAMQLAMVEALKAAQQPILPPLFVVLGYQIRQEAPVKIESNEMMWKAGMSTLYLAHQGTTLRREHGRFLIQQPAGFSKVAEKGSQKEDEIPIAEVKRVLVLGNIQLTSAAVSACLEFQIPVVFLTQLGEYKGHLWSAEFCDLEAEAAQFKRWSDENFQLQMARTMVWGKLINCKQLLLRLNRKRQVPTVTEAIFAIAAQIEKIESVGNLDSLRGHEGTAAACYFPAFGQLLTNSAFSFKERNRRPPKDPVNSLLSFGYTLLFNNVLSLILAEGLNPYLGNLHGSERKEPFLAFDLMEEFRSPVVDSLVITTINKQIFKPVDFTWPNAEGGIYLNDEARRVFLKYFEERISESVTHPDVGEKVSYRRAIHLQIQRYKRCLLESSPYQAFLRPV